MQDQCLKGSYGCQDSVSFLIKMRYIMLISDFFTRINNTETNMKGVYDFLLLVDITFFFKQYQ